MHRTLMRRRWLVYTQLSFLFLIAVYLLLKHDGLRPPASWEIPHHSVDPWPIDSTDGQKAVTAEAGLKPTPSRSYGADSAAETLSSWEKPLEEEGEEAGEDDSQDEDQDGEGSGTEQAQMVEEDEGEEQHSKSATSTATTASFSDPTSSPSATPTPTKEELLAKARTLMPSILDPSDTSIDRMACPAINETRYSYLRVSRWERKHKFFFALNLRKCVGLLPRLLGSLVETIRFLGPEHCAVSIVEGNSDDGTLEVLERLRPELDRLGVVYYLRSSSLDPSDGKRIEKLAMLRAMAVEPVTGVFTPDVDTPDVDPEHNISSSSSSHVLPSPSATPIPQLPLSPDATVLFINDVAACAEDLLELLHQRVLQSADMTCAMDWSHPGPDPLFYDVWVSRALNGDLFFDIPAENGSWDRAADLFFNEPVARARLAAGKPFQVFACWNGAVAFTAAPLVNGEVGFRSAREGECFQGEPQLFCKDMWFRGYGRIAVVPSVNLEYTDELGRKVKKEKGYVGDFIGDGEEGSDGVGEMVPWQSEPPAMVKCMPTFQLQSWMPWNESLV